MPKRSRRGVGELVLLVELYSMKFSRPRRDTSTSPPSVSLLEKGGVVGVLEFVAYFRYEILKVRGNAQKMARFEPRLSDTSETIATSVLEFSYISSAFRAAVIRSAP